jgi:hypothetical protein
MREDEQGADGLIDVVRAREHLAREVIDLFGLGLFYRVDHSGAKMRRRRRGSRAMLRRPSSAFAGSKSSPRAPTASPARIDAANSPVRMSHAYETLSASFRAL